MFFLQRVSLSAFLKFVFLLLFSFFKVSIKHSIEVKKNRFGSDFKFPRFSRSCGAASVGDWNKNLVLSNELMKV